MGYLVHLPAGGNQEKEAQRQCSLYSFLQILQVDLFENKYILLVVAEALKRKTIVYNKIKLILFSC